MSRNRGSITHDLKKELNSEKLKKKLNSEKLKKKKNWIQKNSKKKNWIQKNLKKKTEFRKIKKMNLEKLKKKWIQKNSEKKMNSEKFRRKKNWITYLLLVFLVPSSIVRGASSAPFWGGKVLSSIDILRGLAPTEEQGVATLELLRLRPTSEGVADQEGFLLLCENSALSSSSQLERFCSSLQERDLAAPRKHISFI